MQFLRELIDPNTVSLTNTQQGVLILIKMAATPEVGYESTNGAEQTVYARNSLRTLGLIKVGGNKAVLTQTGQQVLVNYNLTDQSGQLTDNGNEVLTNYNTQYGDGSEGATQPAQQDQQQPPAQEPTNQFQS